MKIDIEDLVKKVSNHNNLFITGQAGVGKTYILKKLIDSLKDKGNNVAVLSSTGISAIAIDGATGHAFFGSGIANNVGDYYNIVGNKIWNFVNKKAIKNTDVIVLDEVSMISGNLFALWSKLAQCATGVDLPFGGIPVIMSGDFLQLPPVSKENLDVDWPFCTNTWAEMNIETVLLTEVKRQDDAEFVKYLGELRLGNLSNEGVAYFTALNRETDKDITRLVSTNAEADAINNSKLEAIPLEPTLFKPKFSGDKKYHESLLKDTPTVENLQLKVGAKVMTTVNNIHSGYVNGTVGIVKEIRSNSVVISTGVENINVELYTWEKKSINGNVQASMTHLPIKLAWAITIHKSQGMTIDELIVDCSRVFAEGQLYVALSRVTNSEKLYLINFDPNKIKVDHAASAFYTSQIASEGVEVIESNVEPEQVELKDTMERKINMNTMQSVKNWKGYKTLNLDNVNEVLFNIESDQPNIVGIDTETTGLDSFKDKPFDIIVGWYDQNKKYKYVNFIAESLIENQDLKTHKYTEMEITAVKKLLQILDKYKLVFHNAKYDITMLMNVWEDFNPSRVYDTQIMTKHIEKYLVDGQSTALKLMADYYNIRSTLDDIEPIKAEYKKISDPVAKGKLIQENINKFPVSTPFLNNLNILLNGGETQYFDMLLYKPEDLIGFYIKLQTQELQEKWEQMFPDFSLSIDGAYKYITDVYNTGELYEECRLKLREFNQKVLGFKDEWATIFKTGTTYNYPDYLNIMTRDASAMLVYAAMDVKLTLDLYGRLSTKAKEYGFASTASRVKVLQQDFDTILPIIQQERTGLYVNKEYIEESIVKAKKLLKDINGSIEQSLTSISGGVDNWKEELGIKDGEDLKANDYRKYNKFFAKYAPYLKLPLHASTKDKIKIDTTTKLCELYERYHSGDQELVDKMIATNKGDVFAPLVGNEADNGVNGLIHKVHEVMVKGAKEVIYSRKAEIEANPKLKMRKEEKELYAALTSGPMTINGQIMAIKNASTRVNKMGNDLIKPLDITIYQVTRTINKKNTHEIKRLNVEEFAKEQAELGKPLTKQEESNIYEIKKVIDLKATEASCLKWIGVYMIKLLGQHSVSADDRIRTSYMIAGPITGRLSADIQQNPKKPLKNNFTGEVVYHPRKAFQVKAPDYIDEPVMYAWLDFSQIELRGAAEYTIQYNMPDYNFVSAYIPFECYSREYGKYDVKLHKEFINTVEWFKDEQFTIKWEATDLHLLPVRQAFPELFQEDGLTPLEDQKDYVESLRGATKGINFGILYGSGLNGILTNPGLADFSTEALERIYNAQKESYPQLAAWQKMVSNQVRKTGIVFNAQGRGYEQGFVREKDKYGNNVYGGSYVATNYVVQGEAAGQLKSRMKAVYDYIKENNLKSKMLANIHDEIFYMVPISEKEHIFEFQRIMQDIPWHIPAVSDIEISVTDWSEKHGVVTMEDIDKYLSENK